jgi:hypothetical protein
MTRGISWREVLGQDGRGINASYQRLDSMTPTSWPRAASPPAPSHPCRDKHDAFPRQRQQRSRVARAGPKAGGGGGHNGSIFKAVGVARRSPIGTQSRACRRVGGRSRRRFHRASRWNCLRRGRRAKQRLMPTVILYDRWYDFMIVGMNFHRNDRPTAHEIVSAEEYSLDFRRPFLFRRRFNALLIYPHYRCAGCFANVHGHRKP